MRTPPTSRFTKIGMTCLIVNGDTINPTRAILSAGSLPIRSASLPPKRLPMTVARPNPPCRVGT